MATSISNRGVELLAIDIAFLSVALLACIVRGFVCVKIEKAFNIHDWLMASATISFVCCMITSVIGIQYGTTKHRDDLSTEDIYMARLCWWICYLLYVYTMVISKASIGCSILQYTVKRIYSLAIRAAICLSVAAGLIMFYVILLQCRPVSYFWDASREGWCIDQDVGYGLEFTYGVLSAITNLTLSILPVFTAVSLGLDQRYRVGFVSLVAMGCVASAAAVAGIFYIKNLQSVDLLWETIDTMIWCSIEQGLVITAGSLAAAYPLLDLIFARRKSSVRSNDHRSESRASLHPRTAIAPRLPISAFATKTLRNPADIESGMLDQKRCTGPVTQERSSKGPPKSPNWFTSGKPVGSSRPTSECVPKSPMSFIARSFPTSPKWFSTRLEKVKRASFLGPHDVPEDVLRDDGSERSVRMNFKHDFEFGRMSHDCGGHPLTPARRSSDVGYEPKRYMDKEFD